MLVYLPGLEISEIRYLFFHGPIWMRLNNSGSFCVGQVPQTSHVPLRPKHVSDESIPCCSGLLQAGPASKVYAPWAHGDCIMSTKRRSYLK